MWLFFKVLARISGHQAMEFTGYVRRSDGTQNVMNGIPRAEGNVPIEEELNNICNKTALGHGKQIVQWLEAFLAFGRCQRSLTTVLLHETGTGYLVPTLPGTCDLVSVGQMTDPTGLFVDGKSTDTEARIKFETSVKELHRIVFVLHQTFESLFIDEMQEFLFVRDKGIIVVKPNGINLAEIYVRIAKHPIVTIVGNRLVFHYSLHALVGRVHHLSLLGLDLLDFQPVLNLQAVRV